MKERIQKILAARGVASRREAERMILDGRISLNGAVVTEMGTRADPAEDVIEVDRRPLPAFLQPRVLMLNKPPGYLSTCKRSREEGREVLELVPHDRRYFPVGRLDRESSGLLLLTDDGDFAHHLMHPRFGLQKVYIVDCEHLLEPWQVRRLLSGVELEDGPARAEAAEIIGPARLRLVLSEGRKREIRRMIRAVGTRVVRLQRIQIGSLSLGNLPEGRWRELASGEIQTLLQSTGPV